MFFDFLENSNPCMQLRLKKYSKFVNFNFTIRILMRCADFPVEQQPKLCVNKTFR